MTAEAKRARTSSVLREVKLKVVDEKTCKAAMFNSTITKSMLCAGGVKNKDNCMVSIIFGQRISVFHPKAVL